MNSVEQRDIRGAGEGSTAEECVHTTELARQRRRRRRITIVVVAVLGLLAVVAVCIFELYFWTHTVLRQYADSSKSTADVGRAITRLGGERRAARRLLTYAKLPRSLATKREWAVSLLGECGPRGIPFLARVFADANEPIETRTKAARAIASIGEHALLNGLPSAEEALPALLNGAASEDVRIRRAAVCALAYVSPGREDVLAALEAAIHDEDEDVHLWVFYALARAGPPGIPILAKALHDPSLRVRKGAAWALEKMGLSARAAIPELEKVLCNPDSGICSRAARALSKMGKDAVPALVKGLESKSPNTRAVTAEVLGNMGSEAKYAIPFLEARVKDRSKFVREDVTKALEKIRGERPIPGPAPWEFSP